MWHSARDGSRERNVSLRRSRPAAATKCVRRLTVRKLVLQKGLSRIGQVMYQLRCLQRRAVLARAATRSAYPAPGFGYVAGTLRVPSAASRQQRYSFHAQVAARRPAVSTGARCPQRGFISVGAVGQRLGDRIVWLMVRAWSLLRGIAVVALNCPGEIGSSVLRRFGARRGGGIHLYAVTGRGGRHADTYSPG